MINDLKQNSIIKDLTIHKVDIDLVYINFKQTTFTESVNKSFLDVIEKEDAAFIGGDGIKMEL